MATERTRVRRRPDRGTHDAKTIGAILDEARICHVGFSVDGQPYVLPTIHARIGDRLYLHGAVANRMLRTLSAGAPCCVTATLVDGLVLARSAFHHSMNYRSVAVLGRAEEVAEPAEKLAALRAIVEHVRPGRWDECRVPNEAELRATLVVRLPLDEASAKIRTGPPKDDAEDYALPWWAGVIPLSTVEGAPEPDATGAPESSSADA